MLVFGADGQLGSEMLVVGGSSLDLSNFHQEGIQLVGLNRADCDISNEAEVRSLVSLESPNIIINCAAMTDVDLCETNPEKAFSVNGYGPRFIAQASALVGAHLTHISTDYVFDGLSSRPYNEWDLPSPINSYGLSKLVGERQLDASSTIVRTSWLCSARGRNIVRTVLGLIEDKTTELKFVNDQIGSPSFAQDIAPLVWNLSLRRARGIYHVTNQGETTWFDFVRQILIEMGQDPERVKPITTPELQPARPALRPRYSVLENFSLKKLNIGLAPNWTDGLRRLLSHLS